MTNYTEEERLDHFRQQSASGLTIQSYCEKYSVNFHTFMNWRKKYRDLDSDNTHGDRAGRFVEVVSPRSASGMGMLHIYLPNGVHLQVDQELDSRLIKLLSDV